ncbi:MAG TPA: UDP-N-acetylmuramoyl-tripeptide--D-alanyl-D-alanine ligase [Coriobacteriia bacterium]
MLTLAAGRIAEVAGGELVSGSPDTMVNGVSVDSRTVTAGCAFVAFAGENVDGHVFAAEALRAGARALIVTRWDDRVQAALEQSRRRDAAVVQVPDAAAAVAALARYHRSRLACPVVGVTGSTGKTTTKDFLTAALGTRLRVTATEGNRNNELGVPLTVLAAGTETDVLVVEMGMRGAGQIAALCEIARPTHGLVTNIGQTHMELLGTQEAIAHAKGELVRCVPPDGRVFLNGDDVWSRELAEEAAAPVTFYGADKGNDVRFADVTVDDEGRPTMTLKAGRRHHLVTLAVPGRHNAYNAAAAAAVALELGLDLKDVAEGLESASLTEWRMQVFTVASGVTVVNDAYNANPTSMRAALTALRDMRPEGRRVAVLGDMAELGSLAELAHFRLGEEVAHSHVDILVTVGALARRIGDGARAEGMPEDSVRPCLAAVEASEVLDDLLEPGDVVLVKASRSMGLERVVEGIVQPRA